MPSFPNSERFYKACASIRAEFEEFKQKLDLNNMVLDVKLVENVVKSWLYDEARHMQFHNITLLEPYKPMAYFIYWFSRIKPIRCKVLCISDRYSTVNEAFAFIYACNKLKIKQHTISKAFTEKFIYMLYYRDIHPEPLFMPLYLLTKATQNNNIV